MHLFVLYEELDLKQKKTKKTEHVFRKPFFQRFLFSKVLAFLGFTLVCVYFTTNAFKIKKLTNFSFNSRI